MSEEIRKWNGGNSNVNSSDNNNNNIMVMRDNNCNKEVKVKWIYIYSKIVMVRKSINYFETAHKANEWV